MSKLRFMLLGSSVLAAATAVATPAFSQSSTSEEVVVTGSLVVRNGNSAPTPVTVVETATLQKLAPTNIPDALNQLPQFSGSASPTAASQAGTAIRPASGNYLNLRNLGSIRGLILLDGQRVPPSSYEGTVDTNILPQALVQRVDVVTAGASAAYGSDAVTGVVNFILDKRFTGLKGSVQGGISEYGDNESSKLTLAGGTPLLDGRMHALFSVEHYQVAGIKDKNERPLWALQPIAYGNGTTIPRRLEFNARTANTSEGGVITNGPLSGQKFMPDGSLTPFNTGPLAALGGIQINSDGSVAANANLVSGLRTDQAFGRLSYDITENVRAFAQVAWGEARVRYAHNGADNRFNNLTIFSDNAYLTTAQRTALGATTSFSLSRQGFEQGRKMVDILNDSTTIFTGLEGDLGEWNWRVNYAYGLSIMRAKHTRNPQNRNYFAAIDAVDEGRFRTGTANGNIVCRVTLTNPTLYPGCLPLNILGANRASAAALEYAFGTDSSYRAVNDVNSYSAQMGGPVFDLPAGPVAVAFGAEYREQSLSMDSNADPADPIDITGLRGFPTGQGRFGNTNQGRAAGSIDVKEAFGEIVVPVLADMAFAQNLELNAAGRITDYSQSGQAETWKVGFSYTPINDLRFRGTISRDIRAPTLNELFAGLQASSNAFADIHTGLTRSIQSIRSGNSALKPEVGTTRALGVVFQPSFLTGFSATLDYYHITIDDAVSNPNATTMNEECELSNGTLPVCQYIIRPLPFSDRSANNTPQRVLIVPQNLASLTASGFDLDTSYRFPLSNFWESSDANIQLRMLANYNPVYKSKASPNAPIVVDAGTLNQGPKWRLLLSADYSNGPLSVTLQGRYIGAMIRSNQPNNVFVQNDVDPLWYGNLAASYKFEARGADMEAFVNVNNLFDQDPPLIPRTTEPGLTYPTQQNIYDVVGRAYTAGVRFRF